MKSIRYFPILVLLLAPVSHAEQAAFPTEHPKNLKAAQAQGLHRLTAEELKAFIPGTMEALRSNDGKTKLKMFKPDGVFEVRSFKNKKGTWRIDTNANTWCRTIEKKRVDVEQCYATFRAPDGVHYFDIDVGDGFYASVWRPKTK